MSETETFQLDRQLQQGLIAYYPCESTRLQQLVRHHAKDEERMPSLELWQGSAAIGGDTLSTFIGHNGPVGNFLDLSK